MALSHLVDLLLGKDPAQRLRLRQNLLAVALMGISVAMLHYAVRVSGQPPGPWLWPWTVMSLGGLALVYVAIRSGWSLRFADPSLTREQIAFAIYAAALA